MHCVQLLLYLILQDLVGLVISMLLLGDFSLVLLTFLQLYSVSMANVFLVLFVLPLAILLPFPAGINALFSHGPRRSAGLARIYALWNITSLINVVSFHAHFSAYCHLLIVSIISLNWIQWLNYYFPYISSSSACMSFWFQVVAFICGYVQYRTQSSKKLPYFQPWNM